MCVIVVVVKKMEENMKLKNKVAIVTGGSSGIGKGIAIEFAKEGAIVVVADIIENPLEEGKSVIEEVEEFNGNVDFFKVDVSSWKQVDDLITNTVKKHGRLDILVNNAAYMGNDMKLHETTDNEWNRSLDVNLKGAFYCTKRAIMQMLNQEVENEARGRIVNVTSQHGMVAALNNMSYGVSKSGLVYMTKQVAADYAKDYIICNAVAPGRILTGRPTTQESIDYSKSRTPFPRLGKPADVAKAAVFLASDEAKFITGVNLMVDGGWMAS